MYTEVEVEGRETRTGVLKIHPYEIGVAKDALLKQGLDVGERDIELALLFAANYCEYPGVNASMMTVVSGAINALAGIIKGTLPE
jgi:hypothetical protein